jgi:hypothetical protein
MEFDAAESLAQARPFGGGFLHAIFAEPAAPMGEQRDDPLRCHAFRRRNDLDQFAGSSSLLTRRFEPRLRRDKS